MEGYLKLHQKKVVGYNYKEFTKLHNRVNENEILDYGK